MFVSDSEILSEPLSVLIIVTVLSLSLCACVHVCLPLGDSC